MKFVLQLFAILQLFLVENGANKEEKTCRQDPPKIAIVGAGIGGTSCAYFIQQMFYSKKENLPEVTIFEAGQLGGRLASIEMAGFEYEAGGSVIHPKNLLMNILVSELDLKKRKNPARVGNFKLNQFTIFERPKEPLFIESSWYLYSILQMVWRYGLLTLYYASSLVSSTLSSFGYIYPFILFDDYSDSVIALLNKMDLNVVEASAALNDTNLSLFKRLQASGVDERFINELATVAVRTNYGQMPDGVHAFVGEVALAGAEGGLWSVEGGNKKVPELLLKKSKAKLVQGTVKGVAFLQDDSKYKVSFIPHGSPRYNWLFFEGQNGGSQKQQKSDGQEEIFDYVVMATPLTKDKANIKFEGIGNKKINFPGKFHRTVATFVHGEVNPDYLGLKNVEEVSSANFLVNGDNKINSLGLQAPVEMPSDVEAKDLPAVWKVFSQSPLTDSELEEIFLSRKETKVVDWLAYPHYDVKQQLGNFSLNDKGLFYINSIEFAASAMEMSAIGAKNVANGVFKLYSSQDSGFCLKPTKRDLKAQETTEKEEL